MGKYDSLFDDSGDDNVPPAFLDKEAARGAKAAKAGAGKYAALFDEPAEDRIGKANRQYQADVAAIPQDRAAIDAMAEPPTTLDAVGAGVRKGLSFGFNDESEGGIFAARDAIMGQQGPGYAGYRDAARARDARDLSGAPVAGAVAEGVSGMVPAMLAPGLAAGGTVADAAMAGAKFGALAGAGNSESDLTKGNVGGFLRDVGANAALGAATGGVTQKIVGGAPERVEQRVLSGISRGEAGGAAKDSLYRKVIARAGEDGEALFDSIGGDETLKRALAVRSKSDPGGVAKLVQRKIDRLTPETDPIYAAIDNAPDPRFANPAKAPKNGGVDLDLVQKRLEASKDAALKNGRAVVAEAYDKALARLRAQYGTDGEIIPGTKLPARAMRNYANEVGENLFTGDVSPSIKAVAKQGVYRDVVGAIEDEGKRVGVDVSHLRQLNKQISTLIPVRDALEDRAAKAASGRTSLGNLLTSTSLVGAGAATHGVEGALTGAAVDAARRAALPAGRMADYQLARLVLAARNGSTPAQLAQAAIEMGVSREVAQRIASGGISALGPGVDGGQGPAVEQP
jgi:hypothetical protein